MISSKRIQDPPFLSCRGTIVVQRGAHATDPNVLIEVAGKTAGMVFKT